MIIRVFIKNKNPLRNWYWLKFAKKHFYFDEYTKFSKNLSLPHLMAELGFYNSVSAARRAGFEGMIEKGFSERYFGSPKNYIAIFNPK